MLWGIVDRHLFVALHRRADPLSTCSRTGARSRRMRSRRPGARAAGQARLALRRPQRSYRGADSADCPAGAPGHRALRGRAGFAISGTIYPRPGAGVRRSQRSPGPRRRLPNGGAGAGGRAWRGRACCCSGSGGSMAPVAPALRAALKVGRASPSKPMDTGAACRTYNHAARRGPPRRRRAAAAGLRARFERYGAGSRLRLG